MPKEKIGVLIAEDSEGLLQILVRTLQQDQQIEVRGVARNGQEAIEQTMLLNPDVITMDLNMPKVDGVEAIRQIMASKPTPIIVVTSAADSEKSFDAIRAGALDVISKPQAINTPEGAKSLAFIVQMVKLMSDVKVITRTNKFDEQPVADVAPPPRKPRDDKFIPSIITIAASTGGPPALNHILKDLDANFPIPILIVQHITVGFGQGLVEWLNSNTRLNVQLARDSELPLAGNVYIAPDNLHLMVDAQGKMRLSSALPIKGHRPSANLLFESAGQFFHELTLGIILTGMGDDGTRGLSKLKQEGGYCIAQNEGSCVVYGMPRAAIDAGLADWVMDLDEVANFLRNISIIVTKLQTGPLPKPRLN